MYTIGFTYFIRSLQLIFLIIFTAIVIFKLIIPLIKYIGIKLGFIDPEIEQLKVLINDFTTQYNMLLADIKNK